MEQDTAMIEWYISRDKIITFIITANSQYPIVEKSSAEDLETLINWTNNYLKGYFQEKEQWINNLAPNLKGLAKILNIDRLLTQINNIFKKQKIKCNRLLLIPHRFLHLFYFFSKFFINISEVAEKWVEEKIMQMPELLHSNFMISKFLCECKGKCCSFF